MIQEIYIIDDKKEIISQLQNIFKQEKEYKFKRVVTEDINIALRNIPAAIIINEDNIDKNILELCEQIRENEDNCITPIIVLGHETKKDHRIEIMKKGVVYYIIKPIDTDYLYYTIKNIVKLMYINRRVSPLTGLPGNVQIQTEMKKKLLGKEEFAVLYFDLDNFKSYNDLYGFSKGDEIIKFTAKTITRNIHQLKCEYSFVGHIGGDDFIAITTQADYEDLCRRVIAEFDSQVLEYFTEDDAKRGYVEVANRRGIMEQFPLTSISIGVVIADKGRFKTTLEIGENGAQVKHLAKTIMGSAYVIDRRK